MALPHSALVPSGENAWLELAHRSALALQNLVRHGIVMRRILTPGALHNAMAVHAAIGGSTNLLLHLPAIAFQAGLSRPVVEDWIRINRRVPRLVDVLPNGPRNYKTVQVYLAGGVPEIMLHLREAGLLDLAAITASGLTVGENLEWWEKSERRRRFKEILYQADGVDPNDVIMDPPKARALGLSGTLIFPQGNLAPDGSVVKCTAIDSALCPGGLYFKQGRARVFLSEVDAIRALKSRGPDGLTASDILVILCRGPLGAGMPETAQITTSLKYTQALKNIALLTDGRFSGFSSGPCIGHIGPEALAGGPIGKLRDGDVLEISLDLNALEGTIHLIGEAGSEASVWSPERGERILRERPQPTHLKPDPQLPAAVRLWALLQEQGGGTWGGCVYDVEAIGKRIREGHAK